MPFDACSHDETDDPLNTDRRNFYKVEKWRKDGHGDKIAPVNQRWSNAMKTIAVGFGYV